MRRNKFDLAQYQTVHQIRELYHCVLFLITSLYVFQTISTKSLLETSNSRGKLCYELYRLLIILRYAFPVGDKCPAESKKGQVDPSPSPLEGP